jgi:hypothetical protein
MPPSALRLASHKGASYSCQVNEIPLNRRCRQIWQSRSETIRRTSEGVQFLNRMHNEKKQFIESDNPYPIKLGVNSPPVSSVPPKGLMTELMTESMDNSVIFDYFGFRKPYFSRDFQQACFVRDVEVAGSTPVIPISAIA